MKINEIKKTKSGKYKVKIDDEIFTTYDDVLLKNNLLYKKNIDISIYEQMQKDHVYYDAYNKTISYILKKIRSSIEIRNYLDKFPISLSDKEKIMEHLIDIGLINDFKYVHSYINDNIYLSNDGPYKIREHLLSLDIDENIISEEMSRIDDDIIEKKAKKLIEKKMKSNHKYSMYQLKQKILLDMINRGYGRDMTVSILDKYKEDDNILLEKEFEKIYSKLCKKYAGLELKNKLRQKMYAKGFNLDIINNLIEKKEGE